MIRESGSDRRSGVRARLAVGALCLPLTALAASPFLDGQLPLPEPQTLVQPGATLLAPPISGDQAAAAVQRRTGGLVLSTNPVQRGGVIVGYDVRVLVDGKRVKDVFVDERGTISGSD
jgi:hypothetical protein